MTTDQGTLHPPVGADDHVLGPYDAPITLVEYGDFQCPHCRRAHGVLPKVLKRLGSRVRFVFRHFPLAESHPNAVHAAEALLYQSRDPLIDSDHRRRFAHAGPFDRSFERQHPMAPV